MRYTRCFFVAALVSVFALGAAAAQGLTRSQLNDLVRMQLVKHGDDGQAERRTSHFAYPVPGTRPAARATVVKYLRNSGFDVEHTGDGVVFEHVTSVAAPKFDNLTIQLTDALAEMDWEYDGWETEVVR